MNYSLLSTSTKAKFISLSFLFVIFGITTVLISRDAPPPVTPVVPVVRLDAPVEDVPRKGTLVAKTVEKVSEARLKIQKIGVDAVIKEMGVTSDGAMAVPGNRVDVAWFKLGTRPGQTGSAVIGGHNLWDSRAGVFAHLDQLEKGDVVSVVDAEGVSTLFVVRDMRTYDAMDTNTGIFESENGAHLNLITCSGAWDPAIGGYVERLVVFTDVLEPSSEIAIGAVYAP